MNKGIILIVLMLMSVASYSQSDKEEIARLKKENEMLREQLEQTQSKVVAAEKLAYRIRYMAIMQALAVKSISINNKEQAGLMALQAYRFNIAHRGYDYDNYIFNALGSALFQFGYQAKTSNEFFGTVQTADNDLSASSDENGLIEVKNKASIIRLSGHSLKVNQIAFSNSRKLMATSDVGRKILIWSLDNLTGPPRVINVDKNVEKLEFSLDDNQLRVTLSDKSSQIFPINHEKMATELEKFLTRNLTKEEWRIFIAMDLPYEKTIASLPEDN
jgi:hypothetical protein